MDNHREEHAAYLRLVRERALELAELVRAAPCQSTMFSAVTILSILSASCQRSLIRGMRPQIDADQLEQGQLEAVASGWRFEVN